MGARSMKLQNANAYIYFELLWRIQREREREKKKERKEYKPLQFHVSRENAYHIVTDTRGSRKWVNLNGIR